MATAPARSNATTLTASALARFQDRFHGQVVTPGHAEYDRARIVWNAIADRRPAVVARCAGVDDVIAAVRFAREQDLLVAVRGGGHSVGGFSTCDGGIVIDLSRMNEVNVDPKRRIAKVQGGALLAQLDQHAQAFGLACPVGVVGHTGVAGLALGGGMGRLQRKHGFTIDNMLGVDIVAADGTTLHASDDENADLFWGIRGAGPNFGVVTSFELQLHPLDATVYQGAALHPVDRIQEVGELFREFVATAPEGTFINMGLGIAGVEAPFPSEMAGRPFVGVGAMHSAPSSDGEQLVRPLRAREPVVDTFGPKEYLALQAMSDDAMAWGKRFYMKSGFVDDISDELLGVCAQQIASQPGRGSELSIWTQGGAISRVPADAMAFTGREAGYWIAIESFWEDPAEDDAHIAWGRGAMAAIKPFTTLGQYVNDAVESDIGTVRGIYGNEKYDRLVGLKRTYDPDNVFRLNQNIRP